MSESIPTASVWGWRGAASGVVPCLKQILHNGERSDIEFAVGRQYGEEQLFRAHKFILSLRSDVFDTMFHGEIPETTEKIELPDILPQAFGVMLKYMYTDLLEDLNLENAMPTLYCAKKYGLPKLADNCASYAIENVDKYTCLTMLEAANVLDAENLVNKCMEIVDINCAELVTSQGFLQLKKGTLLEIFSRDTLIVKEEDVYKAAQRWATNACRSSQLKATATNCREALGSALFAVRFPLMTDQQLANGPLATGLLLPEESHKMYLLKHAAKKPTIPFSRVPRSSDIAFSGRRWRILEQAGETRSWLTGRNVFLDNHGHLRLLFPRYSTAGETVGVHLLDTLGFGRYYLHIEALDQLDDNVGFLSASQVGNMPGVGISFFHDNNRQKGGALRFTVGQPSSFNPAASSTCSARKVPRPLDASLAHHRQPVSVSFTIQRGKEQSALPVVIYLTNLTCDALSSQREVEVIIHSFRFYPDAG